MEVSAKTIKWLRIAVVLVLIGILTEALAFLWFGPSTFLLFVLVGVPCMVAGMVIYVIHVLSELRRKRAL